MFHFWWVCFQSSDIGLRAGSDAVLFMSRIYLNKFDFGATLAWHLIQTAHRVSSLRVCRTQRFCRTKLKLPYRIDTDAALLPYLIRQLGSAYEWSGICTGPKTNDAWLYVNTEFWTARPLAFVKNVWTKQPVPCKVSWTKSQAVFTP